MGLLSSQERQGLGARCKNCALNRSQRIRRRQARALRERAGGNQVRGGTQTSGGEVEFSSTRSFRSRRNHVPNRDRDCGHLGANKKTPVLDGESALRRCGLHFSCAWFRSLTCAFSPLSPPSETPASPLSFRTAGRIEQLA